MSTPPISQPNASAARLIVPRYALASCVRAHIARSTLAATLTNPADRFNHFPAVPFCSIIWYISGEGGIVEPADAPDGNIRVAFCGPQTRPVTTYNPGPVQVFMTTFYPQALHALAGIDVPSWVDRWAPMDEVFGPEWAALSDAVLAAADDDARLLLIESFLEPRWQASRPSGAAGMAGDWVRHLAMQAADTALGRGVRNIERRIKARAGQPLRKLLRMRRAEQSFFDARERYLAGSVVWSDVAARGGYADQAHFCREAREITGRSPLELARELDSGDESYWIYRIWN